MLTTWSVPLPARAGHGDAPPVYTQPLTFASATVTEGQFLTGAAGTPATIGGELRMPVAPGRIPAVILLHGSTGVSTNVRHWADVLNGMGLGTLVVDSFSGRGIAETSTDQARLAHAAMLIDAYRALAVLAAHPRVDGRRLAVMGFAKGGWAAARPIRIVHGMADDWAPIDPCREYVARLRRGGGDAAIVELAGARHLFDLQDLASLVRLPNVQRSGCLTEERAGGVIVSRATGRPPTREECVQFGATIGYDARAYEEALRHVKETLVSALGGG